MNHFNSAAKHLRESKKRLAAKVRAMLEEPEPLDDGNNKKLGEFTCDKITGEYIN